MKGRQRYRIKNKEKEWEKWSDWFPNLFVDDGIELTLDFLFGLKSWWNPLDQGEYTENNIGWDTTRYVQPGVCMFNNASPERGTGQNGIPSGNEYNYRVDDTWLVSPEDSFISRPTGSRSILIAVRRDQVVEFTVSFNVPGDIPEGTPIRELGIFLGTSGPIKDPSNSEAQKPYSMICRSVYAGSGYFNAEGATGEKGLPGFVVTNDVEIQWEFIGG